MRPPLKTIGILLSLSLCLFSACSESAKNKAGDAGKDSTSEKTAAVKEAKAPDGASTKDGKKSQVEIMGKIDKRKVESIIHSDEAALLKCLPPAPKGKMTIRFKISKDGTAVNPIVEADEMKEQAATKCLKSHVSSWKFPRAEDSGVALVKYKLTF
jgi:hypothetical protein